MKVLSFLSPQSCGDSVTDGIQRERGCVADPRIACSSGFGLGICMVSPFDGLHHLIGRYEGPLCKAQVNSGYGNLEKSNTIYSVVAQVV